jgi:deoxyhypusine synthase
MKHLCGKFMGKGSRAQIPVRITPEFINAATYRIEKVDRNLGYQAEKKYHAAQKWIQSLDDNGFVWLGISGAATPVGLGGMVADLIEKGLVDVIVSTGANVYHDLHFACGLPVRHGSEKVDDDALREDETTRIYTQFIHNKYTLKAQDLINQIVSRRIFNAGKLKQPFSTPMFLYEFGKELSSSEFVKDKEGSFVLRAAEYGVPIFLDSASNHSLGMDLSLLALEGLNVDSSPSKDLHQAAALSLYTQPQLNIFLGEGGVRNFGQTTAPTASEIFAIPFEGSAGCIRFTTADERTGGLSGSTESEAVTWGKYKDSNPNREVVVWGEYTLTFPDVAAYVAGNTSGTYHNLGLINQLPEIESNFLKNVKKHEGDLKRLQNKLKEDIPLVQDVERKLRKKAEQE